MEPQEKILKTSLELFFKYGIKHVTMDEIARELGMSKKTIYQFYKEKDDLVTQLCGLELNHHECQFEEMNATAKDPIHEIMMISDRMRLMMQNINPMFFLDLQKFHPGAYQKFVAFKENSAHKLILINIKKGIEEGVYRADLNPEFVSRLRLAQIDMLMFGNYFSYDNMSFAETHANVLDIFVYGICTIKGHKLFNNYKKIKDDSEAEQSTLH